MTSIKRKSSLLRMKKHRYFLNKYGVYRAYRDLKAEWKSSDSSNRILLFLIAVCVMALIALPIYMVHINMEYKENMKQYNHPSKEITQPQDLYYYELHKYDEMNEIRLIRRK